MLKILFVPLNRHALVQVFIVDGEEVWLQDLTITGEGEQESVMEVKGSVRLERCHVDGGTREAVSVSGTLSAAQSILHSSKGHGLVGMGKAELEQCAVSNNGKSGVRVLVGTFHAEH